MGPSCFVMLAIYKREQQSTSIEPKTWAFLRPLSIVSGASLFTDNSSDTSIPSVLTLFFKRESYP